jgi:hypothetical protein
MARTGVHSMSVPLYRRASHRRTSYGIYFMDVPRIDTLLMGMHSVCVRLIGMRLASMPLIGVLPIGVFHRCTSHIRVSLIGVPLIGVSPIGVSLIGRAS